MLTERLFQRFDALCLITYACRLYGAHVDAQISHASSVARLPQGALLDAVAQPRFLGLAVVVSEF
jgi:hypothetical protein